MALVSYNTNARIVFNLISLNQTGKSVAMNSLESLVADGTI